MGQFFKWLITTICVIQVVNGHDVLDLSSPDWSVYNAKQTILTVGPVPGGVYSTLKDAGNISDILFGKNDLNYRWIGREDWSYFRTFQMNSSQLASPIIELVLEGVDTVADVYLNSKYLLSCNNMFLTYTADIKPYLLEGQNNITFLFKSPIAEAARLASESSYVVPPLCHPADYKGECSINMLRKMQASFSWDWGPAFPSIGIWKPVKVIMSSGPVISSIKASTLDQDSNWMLKVVVGFEPLNIPAEDILIVQLYDESKRNILTSRSKLTLNAGTEETSVDLLIPKSDVKLWWPNGYGEQNLYNLRVYTTHSEKTVQIGFRTIELVQEDVSSDENKGKTFYFVVNGVKMFAKGSNWIPSDVLPEKLSDPERVSNLLQAAADSHFNMMRVWGGGVYESDLFYQTCDRLGLLVWQDFMFACSMYPATEQFLDNIKAEVTQQVNRLQHHPSVAIWAGNNENEGALVDNWYGTSANFSLYSGDYVKLYVDTIMPLVANLDPGRHYVTSSPSNGIHSKSEGYISKNPGNHLYGDVHYYNYVDDGWSASTYPTPRFASEYGVQSFPSASCLRSAVPAQDMVWGSELLQHRQHAPDGNNILNNQMKANLPTANNIYDIIYLTQINQAMAMKTETEKYRRLKSSLLESGEGLTMGALYWQLNDIWQAPSWASIDYCGHWKMLHYYAREFFAPLITSAQLTADGSSISVYIVIDGPAPLRQADVAVNLYKWSSDDWKPVKVYTNKQAKLEDNESQIGLEVSMADVKETCGELASCFIRTSISSGGSPIAEDNYLFLAPLNHSPYPQTAVQISAISLVNERTAEISLTAERFALFVWLEVGGVEGTFSRNGFHILQPTTKVIFTSKAPLNLDALHKMTVTWLKQSYS